MNATAHALAPEEVMAFLDGEISADRRESVSAHINECAECQGVRNALSSTIQSVSTWKVADVPFSLQEHVLRKVTGIGNLPEGGFVPFLRRLVSRRVVLAYGVVVALLVLFGLNSTRYDRAGRQRQLDISPVTPEPGAPPASSVATGHGYGSGPTLPVREKGMNPVMLDEAKSISQSGPMIARTVSLSVVVKDFNAGRTSLDAILVRYNGYAANLSVSTPQGAGRVIQASLRIPAPQLAAAIGELKVLGRVENEAQNGEEVTQQHADLAARIKNDRETELRLQDILRTRTGKVKDVLDVEQEIARVRGEIEQMEAEQKTLEHRVDFATIDLKLAEEYKAQLNTPAPSVLMQLRNATITGFRNAFESLLALVLFLAESGPSLLLWLALLGIPAWRLWRRYRRAQSLGSLAGA